MTCVCISRVCSLSRMFQVGGVGCARRVGGGSHETFFRVDADSAPDVVAMSRDRHNLTTRPWKDTNNWKGTDDGTVRRRPQWMSDPRPPCDTRPLLRSLKRGRIVSFAEKRNLISGILTHTTCSKPTGGRGHSMTVYAQNHPAVGVPGFPRKLTVRLFGASGSSIETVMRTPRCPTIPTAFRGRPPA